MADANTADGLRPTVQRLVAYLEAAFTTKHFDAKVVFGLPAKRPRVNVLSFTGLFRVDDRGIMWFQHFERCATRRTEPDKPVQQRDPDAEHVSTTAILNV